MTEKKKYKIKENGKKDTGRPSSMTTETIILLKQAFSLGCSDREACVHAGISERAFYEYQRTHEEFKHEKELLKEKMVLNARNVIADAINRKDVDVAKWYLERKKKDEFSTRVENTGKDGEDLSPVTFNINPIKIKVENGSNQS